MRHLYILLMVVGLLITSGCQNKELLQCQQDNEQLNQKIKGADEIAKIQSADISKFVKQTVLAKGKINTLKEQIKKLNEKSLNQSKVNKTFAKRIKELQKQLNTAKMKIKGASDIARQLDGQNKELQTQFQARVKQLETQLKTAQTKLKDTQIKLKDTQTKLKAARESSEQQTDVK